MNCLILGGSNNQLELIMAARTRGYRTIVVSPYLTDPGVKVADRHIHADIREVDTILTSLSDEKIDLCASDQSDVGSLVQSYICDALGLVGQSPEVILAFADKNMSYQKINESGNRFHPESFFFPTLEKALEFSETEIEIYANWIVKPVNSQGSKGVSRLNENSKIQIIEAYEESSGGGILFQRYIEGDHFSIDAVVVNSVVHPLALAKKQKYSKNKNLDKRLLVKAVSGSKLSQKLANFHSCVVKTLGLVTGLTHGEYVLDANGNIYLIEIAARGGGGNISGKIVKFLTGFNSSDFLLDSALGRSIELDLALCDEKCAILHFMEPDARLSQVDSNSRDSLINLLHFEYNYEKLSLDNRGPADSRSRPGYFIVSGESLCEAQECEKRVLNFYGIESGSIYPLDF